MYNAKSAMSSRRGRANRDEGAIFERYIEISCDYYRKCGAADIQKTPEPFRVTRKLDKGTFIGHYAKKAQPDFQGVLRGGRSIVFDAKSTITDRIPVSALTDEQKTVLIQREEMGAVSGVLMCYSFKAFVFMPTSVFLGAKQLNGHQHWTVEEAQKHGKIARFTGSIIYFLE